MTEKHLDEAINRAVGEMMDVDAEPAFRARVFARLDQPRARISWMHGAAAAGAAAAVVLVGLVLTRTPAPAPMPSAPARAAESLAPSPAPALPALPIVRTLEGGDRSGIGRAGRRPAIGVREDVTHDLPRGIIMAAVADQGDAGDAASAGGIAPIEIAPLRQHPLAPAEIVVPPLPPLAKVQMAPLAPSADRN